MAWYNWSRTAGSNSTADSTINWAEGQAPSTVNDSARAMMARTAEYRDDVAGAITTGGSATAYTVTSYQVFSSLALLSGQMIAFVPHATNTNAVGVDVTLNVDGLGAKSIRMQPSVALPGGTLVLGTPYVVVYNNSDAVFYLRNMTNPYSIPLGGGLDFWGTTTPNSSFAFPIGQAISRTTYATLFSLLSTTYGVGDGSTTFNLPDKTGRVSAMKEASATRLTATWSVNGATLGGTGGSEKNALSSTNQLPQFTPSVSAYNLTIPEQGWAGTAGLQVTDHLSQGSNNASATTLPVGGSITLNSVGSASPSSFGVCQPLIICNYIIRII
jgi:microcystin-dependent protein